MLSVTSSTGFSAPEAADAGPNPSTAGPRDAGGPASPFASMLATRLADDRSRGTADAQGKTETEQTADNTTADDAIGETAGAVDSATGLAHALAALGASPPTLASVGPSAAPAANANVRHVTRDATTLAPALRERLGRVVTRMQDEYGYKVQIAEAGRTQARQDYLFAQGRTRSGPVVTWTRDSAHMRGRAVDVTIDGSYDNPTAFARLQQIAQAEGLHTLGARDPGHLQLPRDVPGGTAAASLAASALGGLAADGNARVTVESVGTRVESTPLPVPTGGAPVATVASVAQVAGVASVAAVATVAAPGSTSAPDSANERGSAHDATSASTREGASVSASRGRTADHTATAAAVPAAAATSGGDAGDGAGRETGSDTSGRGRGTRASHTQAPTTSASAAPAPAWAASTPAATTTARDTSQGPNSAQASAPILGAIAAERIARVLDAQQANAPRTVSHLTLRVERAEGGEDRIHLDLRGRAVDARIDVGDAGAADQLTARTSELRAALAQHGFTTDDVRVQSGADVARDPGSRNDRAPDDRPSDRAPRDGTSRDGAPRDGTRRDQRSRDERQHRRPPADAATLDVAAPNATRRAAS